MGVRIPRITLQVNYEEESSFGELGLLSLGLGIHQAWIFATQFGTTNIFGNHTIIAGIEGTSVSLPFFISSIALIMTLFFMAATNQKFLRVFVSRQLLVASAACMVIGTALLIAPLSFGSYFWETVSGILTGIGSAIVLTFWGTAFARCDSSSIVLNTAVAVTISVAIYAFGLHWLPQPYSGIATAALPLAELGILMIKTPLPFTKRSEIPIFKPLPLNRGKFALRLGLPVFAFGLALGALRRTSVQEIVPAATPQEQAFMLLAACCATIVVMITIMATGNSERWQRFFRPLVPFIAVTLILLPLSYAGAGTLLMGFALMMGYLCFEALLWSFFAILSEQFRISPIFVFGVGRGCLALAILIGTTTPLLVTQYPDISPVGNDVITMIMLVVMVAAYALLPREHEIESLVLSCPAIRSMRAAVNTSKEPSRSPQASNDNSQQRSEFDDNEIFRAVSIADSSATPIKPSGERLMQTDTTSVTYSPENSQPNEPLNHSQTEFVKRAQSTTTEQALSRSSLPTHPLQQAEQSQPQPISEARKAMLDTASPADNARRSAPFRAKCETVANTYLLSVRETEVLFLLAKGNNSATIQEKLYISEGTAKTHIRHIYRKLDIHSQQDLMRLVESASYEE